MSEVVLVSLIFALCTSGTKEDRLACHEKYVNCAITESGILSKTDFAIKCVENSRN